jgi:hypothetical protein
VHEHTTRLLSSKGGRVVRAHTRRPPCLQGRRWGPHKAARGAAAACRALMSASGAYFFFNAQPHFGGPQ